MTGSVEIFFSYAHEDEDLMNDVRRQLVVEERNGRILKWHDRMIPPGADWRQHIDQRLERAAIILLFVSPHFIESRYCYEIEGEAALRRQETGEARVVPIILRPCLWERTPFGALQALPRDAQPVSRWPDRDEACLDVARGVMSVVDEVLGDQPPHRRNSSIPRTRRAEVQAEGGNRPQTKRDVGTGPALVFVYDKKSGWLLRNVGKSAAVSAIVAERRFGGAWENPVITPPLEAGRELALRWVNHRNVDVLGVEYRDLGDNVFSTICEHDRNAVREGSEFPEWPAAQTPRFWNAG